MEADREPNRGVALSVSNAVFSKLIKLGRERGQTPQRAAQALFEDGYAAACLGKTAKQQVAAAGAMADAMEDDLLQQLGEARNRIADLEAEAKLAAGVTADLQAQLDQARQVIAGKDRALLDQADEIRALHEAAKGQLVVVNQASEILKREAAELTTTHPSAADLLPGPIIYVQAVEQANHLRDDGTPAPHVSVRTIKAMKAAGNRPAQIARDLGLDIATVREVLG